VIENAKKLFDAVASKFGTSSNVLLLNGKSSSGYAPSQPGLVESQDCVFLSLRTGSAESKGILTGVGFFVGAVGILLVLLPNLFGAPYSSNLDWWVFLLSVLVIFGPAIWEINRPPSLPIVFNRRTQEIYYDLKGELYHAEWSDIEAVAYEYQVINQYSGSIVHGNLEIILKKFGAPDDRIALNLSGVPAGKRLRTVVGIWEYLRCYMTIGPWFDENGNRTEFKSLFIDKSLKSGELSFFDLVLESRRTLGQERQEGHGVSGAAFLSWLTSYMLFLPAFGMECIQKIDRKKARHRWPDVVQERLDPNGPTTRLIDIEEEYMVQKQQELDDLHERMRKTLPR
jgi:hypothetical protein